VNDGEKVTSRSVLILFALLAVTPASCAQQRIVSIGPSGQLIEQLRYLDDMWPDQHAVALVVASESPICGQVSNASESSTWYCDIWVAASEFLALHWASQSPPEPGSEFLVHFWHRGAKDSFRVIQGTELLVLLAPTHFRHKFTATVIAKASPRVVAEARSAVYEVWQ